MQAKTYTKKRIKPLLIAVLLLLFGFSLTPATVLGANYPLKILNIKPAATGDPAIPETNRIFRAHPGVEYNIRAAVTGGLYPYTYELSNAPSGMSINSDTGEITWNDPQSDSGTITITVTDSEGSSISADWSIDVTTEGFIFVDSTHTGTENGTLSEPYSSLEAMLRATQDGTHETDIVYFRGGNYGLIDWVDESKTNLEDSNFYQETGKAWVALNHYNNPYTWIGFPGETVNIDGKGRYIASLDGVWFDDLNFSNFSNYIVVTSSKNHYSTMRRCDIDGVNSLYSTNDNFGCYFTYKSTVGHYTVLQDNTFSNLYNVSAIGSLYGICDTLVEDNEMLEGVKDNGIGPATIDHPFMFKAALTDFTARANRIVVHRGRALQAMMADNSADIEICFNLFVHESEFDKCAAEFNRSVSGPQGATYIYRNTIVGVNYWKWFDPDACYGPWEVYQNVFVNRNESRGGHYDTYDFLSFPPGGDSGRRDCINTTDNLMRTYNDNPLDENYNLNSEYDQYLGVYGHQIVDSQGETMEGDTAGNDPLSPPGNPRISSF